MNKKWLIAMICILLVVIIGVGGKVYMDKKAEQKEEEKIEAERMSVEALKERYANIKSVEIKESSFDKKTGAFDVMVKMTNQENESVDFSYPFWVEEKEIGAILVVDKNVQTKGQTTNKIHVIFTNKNEGEI